jgi:hypothetical protein
MSRNNRATVKFGVGVLQQQALQEAMFGEAPGILRVHERAAGARRPLSSSGGGRDTPQPIRRGRHKGAQSIGLASARSAGPASCGSPCTTPRVVPRHGGFRRPRRLRTSACRPRTWARRVTSSPARPAAPDKARVSFLWVMERFHPSEALLLQVSDEVELREQPRVAVRISVTSGCDPDFDN